MTDRRWQVWLAAWLILLQALAPAVHIQQHGVGHRHPHRGGLGCATSSGCACGHVHVVVAPADARVPRQTGAELAADHEHCAVCELLRSLRHFDGPPCSSMSAPAAAAIAAECATVAARFGRSTPFAFAARAPPRLLA